MSNPLYNSGGSLLPPFQIFDFLTLFTAPSCSLSLVFLMFSFRSSLLQQDKAQGPAEGATVSNMSEDKDLLDRIAKISGIVAFWPCLNHLADFAPRSNQYPQDSPTFCTGFASRILRTCGGISQLIDPSRIGQCCLEVPTRCTISCWTSPRWSSLASLTSSSLTCFEQQDKSALRLLEPE